MRGSDRRAPEAVRCVERAAELRADKTRGATDDDRQNGERQQTALRLQPRRERGTAIVHGSALLGRR
jgi:hypothetical protein